MITDEDIKQVTEAFVTISNNTGALTDVVKHYDQDRTLGVRIIGSKFRTGFIFKNGSVHMLSDLDKPTVIVTMDKETFWNVINSENAGIARTKIYLGVMTEETIVFDPPPGTEGGTLHMENVIKAFCVLAESVMTGGE